MQEKDIQELERYRAEEAAGLLLHLPVPLGSEVWEVRRNPSWNCGKADAEEFLYGKTVTPRWTVMPEPFTLRLLPLWGKSVFASEDEGRELLQNDTF